MIHNKTASKRKRKDELTRLALIAGSTHRFHVSDKGIADGTSGEASNTDDVLEGGFELRRLRPGVQLHTFNGRELNDMTAEFSLPPGLTFCVLLEGCLSFALNGEAHTVSADERNCFAINLCRPATLERQLHKGAVIRKVNISVEHAWLEERLGNVAADCAIRAFMCQHAALPRWRVNAELQAVACDILNLSDSAEDFSAVRLEARILDFIGYSLQLLSGQVEQSTKLQRHRREGLVVLSGLKQHQNAKAERLRNYIENHLREMEAGSGERQLDVDGVAKALGMSVSSLQRLCKRCWGTSLLEYIRQRRLILACDALIQRRVSVGEAAFLAGYKHTPNFTAAFKRLFGISPGSI